jgi:hypothetical protein
METSTELLRICGYTQDSHSLDRVEQVKKNYSHFDDIVVALLDLEEFLVHSDFYISLRDDYDLIEIRNDMYSENELIMLDGDIVEWANYHNIDFIENSDNISILGIKSSKEDEILIENV